MELNAHLDGATYAAAFSEMVTVINEVNTTARARQTSKDNDAVDETES